MKRITLLLLTVVYLLSTLGVAADSYYCRGKLQSTSVLEKRSALSGCKMRDQMKGCCKTKKQLFKLNDTHIYASSVSLDSRLLPVIQIPCLLSQSKISTTIQKFSNTSINAPPKGIATPAYILNCNYRI
jgi:hypothetical protein